MTTRPANQIPIPLLCLALVFRVGAFLIWPAVFAGILALCGFGVWAMIEAQRIHIGLSIAVAVVRSFRLAFVAKRQFSPCRMRLGRNSPSSCLVSNIPASDLS